MTYPLHGYYWILDGKIPVQVDDALAWSKMFEDFDGRRVGRTEIGEVTVSTVFLGIDHRFGRPGPPILFETMIEGLSSDGGWNHQSRYSTWEEAEEGHRLAVEFAQSVIDLAKSKTERLLEPSAEGRGA